MPFGDNVKTYQARVRREQYSPGLKDVQPRRVRVPEADPPWWWSEYLTDEWKRVKRYEQVPRDPRTQWQRSQDAWAQRLSSWGIEDFGLLGNRPGLTRPPHQVWG